MFLIRVFTRRMESGCYFIVEPETLWFFVSSVKLGVRVIRLKVVPSTLLYITAHQEMGAWGIYNEL